MPWTARASSIKEAAVFRMEDGVSFVHVSAVEDEEAENPLTSQPAFQAFVAEIKERCDEPPAPAGLEQIGGYQFFGGGES